MLDANKIYIWTIIMGLLLIIPGIQFFTVLDELCVFIFFSTALLDSIVNHCWKKYRLLWIVIGIIGAYAIYSIIFLSNNTTPYVLMDWLIEVKPFVPFTVLLGAGISFSSVEKSIIQKICIINCIIISLILIASSVYFGAGIIKATVYHPTYSGHIILISALFYIYCKLDHNGDIDRTTLWTVILFLTLGLLCGRSKYFAIYVCTIPFLLYYKPRFTKHLTPKQLILLGMIFCLILAVTWQKLSYYFISGSEGMDKFDPKVLESFARPVLYVTGYLILFDYFPFGSGLASFASYPSSANYSNVYYEYGINNVWGLSPTMPDFICDAYYPSLAQFGIVGLILFIWFWIYAYSFIRTMIRNYFPELKYNIIIGSLCIIFILVESTTGTTFTFATGALIMSLLGIVSFPGYELKKSLALTSQKDSSEIQLTEYKI